MKLALVADWLPTYGGAEHVLAEFHALWPSAPLYTTIANRGALGPLDDADIRVSSLQRLYNLGQHHRPLLPWMPLAIERMDLRAFDMIISSSHAVGKGIIPPSHARHICYCHTPMRYAWEMEEKYLDDFRVPKRARKYIKRKLMLLRRWDMTTSKRVDQFIANSHETQERIRRIYNRDSVVIPPPVHDRFFEQPVISGQKPENYYLAIGRLVPYKRFDLLVETANALKLPLKIAGDGHDRKRLKALAGETVEFLGYVADTALPGLYANANALLFPQYEDAGVVPLETQASGTPVIAYGKGGALDSIVEGRTGTFFYDQTVDSLQDALRRFSRMQLDSTAIREHARQFSSQKFKKEMLAVV